MYCGEEIAAENAALVFAAAAVAVSFLDDHAGLAAGVAEALARCHRTCGSCALSVRGAEFGQQFFERRQSSGMNQPQQSHFQMHARVGFAAQIVVGLQKNIEKPGEIFFAELGGGFGQRGTLIGSGRDQFRIRSADASDQQIAHVANRFAAKMLQVAAFFLKSVNESKGTVRGPGSDGLD